MCFLFVIVLVLWKFNTMCFDQYPSIPPTSATHSLSTQICVFFCFHPSSPICGTSIFSDVRSSTGMWSNLPEALLLNWTSSSQHPSAVNASLSKSETTRPPLLSMLGVGLAWACTSLMHAATTTVSSYVPLPFGVQTTPSNALFVFLGTFPGRCRHTAPISFSRMSIFDGDPLKLIMWKSKWNILCVYSWHVELYSPKCLLWSFYMVE